MFSTFYDGTLLLPSRAANCFSVCLKLSLSAGNPGLKPNFDAFDGLALDNFVLDNGQTNERLSFRRVPGGTYGQMFLTERGPKKRGRNEQQWTRWRQEALEEFPLRDVLSFKFDHL
ncbi:hypothetical protein niasHS_006489 [Heterodera schachtii]|uniref:Uncharacterized protein n=1 Tax=Heterodera schachtii TaxID=97005 RepID=A0ABD2JHP2_HETSC